MLHISIRVFFIFSALGSATICGEALASFSARPYFPIGTGNSWSYRVDDGSSFTTTVSPGTTNINGIATSLFQDSDGFASYFTNDSNGIRLHRQFDPDSAITVTYSPPIKFANASTDIGQTVNSSGTAATNLGNLSYTSSYTIEAFENVNVPAGSFATVRVRGTVTLCNGSLCDSAVHIVNLARNIGVVKEFASFSDGSYTNELTGTNVKAPAVVADFDGDSKTDIGIYRDGVWAIRRSSDNGMTVVGLGGAADIPVPADYDGDGLTDEATYLNGLWTIKRSSDGAVITVGFGGPSFTPVPADYDGDGKADIAVYSNGVWSILRSSDGGNTVVAHGGPGWIPVPADYDGDGKADVAVYINGAWSIKRSSDNVIAVFGHGGPSWEPVPADYDGDGKADIAVYTGGAWSIRRSSDNIIAVSGHGGPAWVPVPADYDGDGKADIAVYNANGAWSIIQSSNSAIQVVGHGGGPTDVPLTK